VGERVEQRGLQLLVAAGRLRLAGALERRTELLIQLFDLATALLRFELPPLGARCQLANDDRGQCEGEEGHPVVQILDEDARKGKEEVDEREPGTH